MKHSSLCSMDYVKIDTKLKEFLTAINKEYLCHKT